jgi:hypothetical protein
VAEIYTLRLLANGLYALDKVETINLPTTLESYSESMIGVTKKVEIIKVKKKKKKKSNKY